MASETTSSGQFQVHGGGVANSGNYPDIKMSFDITFTRETGDQKVTWATSNTEWWHPTQWRYGFQIYVYVAVNPVDPDNPDYSELWTILEKDNTVQNNWWNYVDIYNRGYPTDSGCYINSTTTTANVYVYVSSDCTDEGHLCYGSPTFHYYCVHSFSVTLPTYETFYTVTYNNNGGQGNIPAQTKSSLNALTLTTSKPTFPLSLKYYNNADGSLSNSFTINRAFLGWKCSADGNTYQPGGEYSRNEDCTMTAQWGSASFTALSIPNRYYTVTYNYNGGTGSPASVTCQRTEVGYATSPGSTTKVYDQGVTYNQDITSNLSLYPIYGDATLTSLPTPTRKGYTFLGWYKESTFVNAVVLPLTLTGDTTLYAKWSALPIHLFTNGKWESIGPYVWRFNANANQWERVAHIYKFNANTQQWEDLSI